MLGMVRTWWAVWVVLGKGQLGLEVAAVVKRVRVQHDECDTPLEDILVDELEPVLIRVHTL